MAQPRELLDSIGAVLQANINLRFDTKTDPSGQRWAPISALTPQFYALTHNSKGQPRKPTKEGWASPGTYTLRIGTLGGEPGSAKFRLGKAAAKPKPSATPSSSASATPKPSGSPSPKTTTPTPAPDEE